MNILFFFKSKFKLHPNLLHYHAGKSDNECRLNAYFALLSLNSVDTAFLSFFMLSEDYI